MKLVELAFGCYVYTHMSNYDDSYRRFLAGTRPELDLALESHRMALLAWLNAWGCRQFAKAYHDLASEQIAQWYEQVRPQLIPRDKTLLSLTSDDSSVVEVAYANLVERTASRKRRPNATISDVTIGPTGAAKILFALRPEAVIPWDDPIRKRFKADGSPQSYCNFLQTMKNRLDSLAEECAGKGISFAKLPALLGRQTSSVAKLLDEYFWVTITKQCPVPEADSLARWASWL